LEVAPALNSSAFIAMLNPMMDGMPIPSQLVQSLAHMCHSSDHARHLHADIIDIQADGHAPGLPLWHSAVCVRCPTPLAMCDSDRMVMAPATVPSSTADQCWSLKRHSCRATKPGRSCAQCEA